MTDPNAAAIAAAKQSVWTTLAEETANLPAIEKASLFADVAGIFDPTPVSDGVGAILSASQGDLLGTGLSILGMIPYVGDLGKIAKIAKRAPKTAALLKAFLTKADGAVKTAGKAIKESAAAKKAGAAGEKVTKAVRETLAKAKKAPPCKECEKLAQKAEKAPTRFIEGVVVIDRKSGKVLSGTVDLKPTLDRIKSGGRYPHKNDGSVFKNRPPVGKKDSLLPTKPEGFYKEYVMPTTGVKGPGPQRIVVGKDGKMFYTPDHYDSFIPIN